jgi:hypothetical protein
LVFAAIIFVVTLLSTILFAIIKVSLSDINPVTSNTAVDSVYVFTVSVSCGAVAIFTTFAINTLRNLMEHWDVPEIFRSDTTVMLEEWKQ